MSRLAPTLFLALAPAGAVMAAPASADQAMRNYRSLVKSTRELDCPAGESADEIVVCGRPPSAPDPDRLPLPVERVPGARAAGEPLSDGGGCISRCHQPVMVPLHKAPAFIGKVIERLKDR